MLALAALIFHVSGPGGDEKPAPAPVPKTVAAEKSETPPPVDGPWLATRSFFGDQTFSNDLPVLAAPAAELSQAGKVRRCLEEATSKGCLSKLRAFFGVDENTLGTYEFNFVLATVPDPMHTRLALFTDSSIHAIENAASQAGWVFAGQWLPWGDTIDPGEKDPAKRQASREAIREQESEPGVLVFRARAGDAAAGPRVLLVFIVGETPTSGVNPGQFQLARAYTRALDLNSGQVLVQGPTFTGSFYSLGHEIYNDQVLTGREGGSYIVRSGAVTSADDRDAFVKLTWADFASATASGKDQLDYFFKTLGLLGIDNGHAGMLIEDESGFGDAVAQGNTGELAIFRYPRDISHLRNAYKDAVRSSKSDAPATPVLDFSLKDNEVGEDSVPTFSTIQTPLAENGILNQIIDSIRRRRLRIVQITASNVLDTLFLTRVLARQCPDTRVLVQSPELLYVQAAENDPLTGMLALSTYPLFPEAAEWMGRKTSLIHPDANSEGVFNATLLLLNHAHLDVSNGTKLADYGWDRGDGERDLAPFWLLTLDRQGFMPVNVWAETPRKYDWFDLSPWGGLADLRLCPSRTWTIVSSLLALGSIGLAFWVVWLHRRPHYLADARLEIARIGDKPGWRLFYLSLFFGILCWMQVVLLTPLAKGSAAPLVLPFFGALCAFVMAALTAIAFYRKNWKPGFLATLLIPVSGAAGLYLWAQACCVAGDRAFFFSFRAIELRLGSSPLWPLLAAAGALLLFCLIHVTRHYYGTHLSPEVAVGGGETGLQERLICLFDQFRESATSIIGCTSGFAWFAGIFAVLPGIGAWYGMARLLSSIDGGHYDVLLGGMQATVVAVLLLTCMHIRKLWHLLYEFLTILESLPLAGSFIPLESTGGARPIWVRRLHVQNLKTDLEADARLHDLGLLCRNTEGIWYEPYERKIKALLSGTPGFGDKGPKSRRTAHLQFRRLRAERAKIAKEMFDNNLAEAWRKEKLGPQAGTEASPRTDVTGLCQTFVALHYSSFLMYGVGQIQNLILFVSVGFVLLMISMSAYSLQAPRLIGRFLLILFVCMGFVVCRCLAGMERNPILSKIGNTNAGKLDTEFYLKLAGYGALPVLGLLASEFPSVSTFLFSWVQPALEAVK